jgi:hypothetical protein
VYLKPLYNQEQDMYLLGPVENVLCLWREQRARHQRIRPSGGAATIVLFVIIQTAQPHVLRAPMGRGRRHSRRQRRAQVHHRSTAGAVGRTVLLVEIILVVGKCDLAVRRRAKESPHATDAKAEEHGSYRGKAKA